MLKVTLPASIVVNFAQINIDLSMLAIVSLALLGGFIYIGMAFLINLRADKEQRAFDLINLPGYNIGLVALPFVQNFVGPVGVVAAGLFDAGNAFISLGGTYGIASSVKDGSGFSFKRIGKALVSSIPFMSYILMLLINLVGITVPKPILSFADILKNANTFMAMLMIGVGFKLNIEKKHIAHVLKIIIVRYSVAAAIAAGFFYLLPFSYEIRQTLVLMAFSPIGASTPAFTQELRSDVGLSSVINSSCIIISICLMTALMVFM